MEQVAGRTPAAGRDGVTNVPVWKFDLFADGPRACNDVRDAIGARQTADEAAASGKVALEVRGEIARVHARGPQQIRLT